MTEPGSQQVPISEAMRLATEHHQAGRLPEAEAIYRAVLDSDPGHAGAGYNLALIALQQGRAREAVPVMRDATEREPKNVTHWMNYAVALAGSGQPRQARDVLLKARQRKVGGKAFDELMAQLEKMLRSEAKPTVVETVGEGGSTALRSPNLQGLLELYEKGQFVQVESQVREFWPEFAHSAMLARLFGGALLALNKVEEAREALQLASGTHGGDAVIHRMLGMALRGLGRSEEAQLAFVRSLEIAPDNLDTLLHAAVNALALREPEQARSYGERVLASQPDRVGALWVVADAVASEGNPAEAIELYRRAIALDPDVADLYINLGDALNKAGRPQDATVELEQALRLRPNDAQAHLHLGAALFRLGETGLARERYRLAADLAPARPEILTAYLFSLLHDAAVSPEESFAEHLRIGEMIEAPRRYLQRPHENDRDPERSLRIGFVSADLRDPAVAYLVEPVWRAMRQGRHQIYAYANMVAEDAVSERLRALTDSWLRVDRMGDEALAERIRQDRIDILVDLSGHTTGNRLPVFAMKPAPVQVTWLGSPATTGMPTIDYRILRRFTERTPDFEKYFSEKVAWIRTRVFQPERDAPPVAPLPALAAGYVTFASFNKTGKIGEPAVDLWSRVLHAVPGSHMLIGAAGEPGIEERLRAQFAARGIGAERLQFRAKVPMTEYLAMHGEVDIVLDSFPHTGGTTASHALWMGVPVLTLAGETARQNQSTSLLAMYDLSDWVVRSADAYVAKAEAAASDLPALDRLRREIRPRIAASLEHQLVATTHEMDSALQTMWRRWCAGLPPESFTVSD